MNTFGIHWFRRDLRIAGNAALREQVQKHHGRVLGLFTFDNKFLGRPDFSSNRFQFFLKTLCALRDDLRATGGDLLVLPESPDDSFETLKKIIDKKNIPSPSVSWSRDYEPFARGRDERIKQKLESWNWPVTTERDHLLIEPEELSSNQGTPYKVYTPFSKRWFELFQTPKFQERIEIQSAGIKLIEQLQKGTAPKLFSLTWTQLLNTDLPKDHLESFMLDNAKNITIEIPDAGSRTALKQVHDFKPRLNLYGEARDFMAQDGTSKLAIFLKNGSLTVAQIIAILGLQKQTFKSDGGASKFIRELIWREFYYHVLWHFPNVEKEAFNEKYRNLHWHNDKALFEAWKIGMTGFPIVDAAMRQLLATGWMHNRARMIVASFLTKDLLVDWKWGEGWFMNQLLDGDLAPNNGGWQWAASTGCDAQPYFRIFNPVRQSERFDPNGDYIRRYVPELKKLDAKEIHWPSETARKQLGYPAGIVDHREQSIRAQMLFKK